MGRVVTQLVAHPAGSPSLSAPQLCNYSEVLLHFVLIIKSNEEWHTGTEAWILVVRSLALLRLEG